ncbi:MAG: right-handed parallel beta-helix repeat-containing protein, partial [Candidatus Heimdallarchaeota archaeon]|nr:right-handed parallel beta-helix repeat-containing protein [Candidatus Heimdallarchaeota archaeon]MCK5144337.1 right-handed parallel beta-helix repeat-containing protein [Candidatus Heimdallarchaeota archaeon]
GSKYGLTAGKPKFFNISFNKISNNDYGIQFTGKAEYGFSENCTIFKNLISDNLNYGIVIYNGKFNIIHHNSFIDNNQGTTQAFDSGFSNFWFDSSTMEGNFWSDFSGIGTYTIAGPALAEDLYPLLTPPV